MSGSGEAGGARELRGHLTNGMRYLIERVEAPVASIYLWIDAGSADEAPGEHGAAHALEHMLFKGTSPPGRAGFGVGELAAAVEGAGGDINAWTSYDETVYHLTIPPDGLRLGLEVLAQMLSHATLDAQEFKRERAVIVEEIRGVAEEPDQVLGEALYAHLFAGHPYARPITGAAEEVAGLKIAALKRFYERHYRPANCCIAAVGPGEPAAVLAEIAARFGGGGARMERRARRADGTEIAAGVRAGVAAVQRDFPGEWREIAFAGPGHRHPDVAALELLGEVIGGSASAPAEGLRRELGLCAAVSARYEAEQEGGLFTLYLQTAEGQTTEGQSAAGQSEKQGAEARQRMVAAAGALLGELVERIDRADLERAKAQLLAERAFSRETTEGRAHSLVFQDRVMGDPDGWRAYDAAIAGLGLAEVQAAARKYLVAGRAAQVILGPEAEAAAKEVLAACGGAAIDLEGAARGEIRRLLGRGEAQARAAVTRHRLSNGLEVLLEPTDSEVVGVRLAGRGGALLGPPGWAGLWARMVGREAGGLSARRFAAEVERLGASMSAPTGRSTQGLALDVPAGSAELAMELLAVAVREPSFAEEGLALVRAEQDAAREEEEGYPEAVMSRACWALAFPKHPWGQPPKGTAAGLLKATGAGLARLHARWARAGNLAIAVAGGFEPERMLWRLERLFGGLLSGGAGEIEIPPGPAWAVGDSWAGQRVRRKAGQGQAQLALVYPGCAATDPRQPAMSLLAGVLGGQGGRLFMELRERRGLAYDVGAELEDGLAGGILICSLGLEPKKVREAEVALRACVAELAELGPAEEELRRAARSLVGAGEADLQTMAGRARAAAYTAVYGRDATQYRALMREVESVGPEAVRAALGALRGAIGAVHILPEGG